MTKFIQKILAPVDLSDFSRGALRWAAMFHRELGTHITVMFANTPYFPIDMLELGLAEPLPPGTDLREGLLRKFARENLPAWVTDFDTVVVDAAPAQAINETARNIDADLIVMATESRKGWRRALLGSVTENVVHHADRAVMSIPLGDGQPVQPVIHKILCPVSFTPIGRQALEEAAGLAQAFAAELLVVHVADLLDEPFLSHVERFGAWVEPAVRERCRYSQLFARGNPAEQVLHMAAESHADMIVLGAQHKRFSDSTVIGTTTERVIRFAKVPVLTVVAAETPMKNDLPQPVNVSTVC